MSDLPQNFNGKRSEVLKHSKESRKYTINLEMCVSRLTNIKLLHKLVNYF